MEINNYELINRLRSNGEVAGIEYCKVFFFFLSGKADEPQGS